MKQAFKNNVSSSYGEAKYPEVSNAVHCTISKITFKMIFLFVNGIYDYPSCHILLYNYSINIASKSTYIKHDFLVPNREYIVIHPIHLYSILVVCRRQY